MECDEIPAGGYGIDTAGFLPQGPGIHQFGGERLIGFILGGGQVERDVGLLERGNLIMAGVFGVPGVLRTVDQVQVQAVLAFADHDAFFGQGNVWIGGVAEVRHEYALPKGCALGVLYVLHVEHDFGESLIENPRLDFKRHLRALEAVLQMAERRLGSGCDIQAVEKGHDPGGDDKDRECTEEGPHAHAGGAHGGDFAVGRKPTQPDQDTEQHAHGQGVSEGERDGEEENFGDAGQWGTGADH